MSSSLEKIGLIAGSGALASEFLQNAKKGGYEVRVVALSEEIFGALSDKAEIIVHLSPGQPKKIIKFFLGEDVRRIGFAGKVEKSLLFQKLRFDIEALRFLSRTRNMSDGTIMNAVLEYCEKNGIEVLSQKEYLSHLLAPEGQIGNKRLKRSQIKDASYAFRIAREIARLELGQTVVVHKGAVVALEAIEGTNETIRRGGRLSGRGPLVCKVARPNQDPRYDIPVVGLDTMIALREAGAAALIIEAGNTFLLGRDRMVEEADAAGIAIFGWTDKMGE